MTILIAIIGAIMAFFTVVLVHECGHFFVARWVGIRVLRFSIGFGKSIFTYRAKSGIDYAIGILPLGGYVKMDEIAYQEKSLWARMCVVIAGPIANFILAFLVFSAVFSIGITQMKPIVGEVAAQSIAAKSHLQSGDRIVQINGWKTANWQRVVMFFVMHIGENKSFPMTVLPKNTEKPVVKYINLHQWQFDPMKPNLLSSIGITPYFPAIPPVISEILPHSPASHSALKAGDRIIALNQFQVRSWQALVTWIEQHPSQRIVVTVSRSGRVVSMPVAVGEKDKRGFLGLVPAQMVVSPSLQITERYPWYLSAKPAFEETATWVIFHLVVIKQLLLGRISLKTLGGPISIFQTAGSASLAGWLAYLQFIGLISVIIGVLNLLPIPALDGGHFIFFAIEAIIRRPVPENVQIMIINVGVILLVTLMFFATVNDVSRLLH